MVGPQEWRTRAHNGELAGAILGMSGHCCMFSCRLSDSSYEWEVQDVSGPYTIERRFVIVPHVRWLRLAVWWNGEGVQVGPDACTWYGHSNCMYLLGLMTVHWSTGTLWSVSIENTQNSPHIHSSFEHLHSYTMSGADSRMGSVSTHFKHTNILKWKLTLSWLTHQTAYGSLVVSVVC